MCDIHTFNALIYIDKYAIKLMETKILFMTLGVWHMERHLDIGVAGDSRWTDGSVWQGYIIIN